MKNRIREVMQKANLSQQDFAAKLGVSPASISNIFIGRTNPTITHAFAVHKAFPEVSMNWLLFGEGEMSEGENAEQTLGKDDAVKGEIFDFGDEGMTTIEGGLSSISNVAPTSNNNVPPQKTVAPVQNQSQSTTGILQRGGGDQQANLRNSPSTEVPDFASQTRYPTYNDLQNAKNCDKPARKVKEIRVFYDDGTYEIFIPAMK
jgi:transcriptional regulator with XRE-family HTH domain